MNFSQQLLSWYQQNKRDLPWRRTKDPYRIWLSEIILQQTRIEQGTPYYEKIITAYPTVKSLAVADEQEILKLWQGLGYYSRARNLHETARLIADEYGGIFPANYSDIRRLKGVGDYTAAAIASICFTLPHAVVDGNVMRFLSRVFGIVESIDLPWTRRKIQAIASENLDTANPGDFNQAMMEFGAMVCTPANPDCTRCIFNPDCFALQRNSVMEIPFQNPKQTVRQRYIHYLVLTISDQGTEYICLNRRSGKDIWKNLFDFPVVELQTEPKRPQMPMHEFNDILKSTVPEFQEASKVYIHLLTHQKIHARFYRFHCNKMIDLPYMLVPLMDLGKYPVPKLIERYLVDQGAFR